MVMGCFKASKQKKNTMSHNAAVPSKEEGEYIAEWMRSMEGGDEAAPGVVQYALSTVCAVLLYPVTWLLHYLSATHLAHSIAAEDAHTAASVALPLKEELPLPSDIHRWKLHTHKGRHVWTYEEEGHVQDTVSALMAGVPQEETDKGAKSVDAAVNNAASYLASIQSSDGHWANDYGGPNFLLPGLVFTKYILCGGDAAKMFPKPHTREMIRYLRNTQNPDGGWGLNEQGLSSLFGTVLNYVVLRLLGVGKEDGSLRSAHAFLKTHGGAVGVPPWGKAWLALLNLYSWEGVSPVAPELWLLPKLLAIHPGRMWCHTRMVYIPLSYLYGRKFQMAETELIKEIREEIFMEVFSQISWKDAEHIVSPLDQRNPTHFCAKAAFFVLRLYEKVHSSFLRNKSVAECLKHIVYDDCTTNFVCLGPVNKTLNLVVMFAELQAQKKVLKKDAPELQQLETHVALSTARLDDYLFLGKNGMKMTGYNGSQLWDTAFALQAVRMAGLSATHEKSTEMGKQYIFDAQVVTTPPQLNRYNRDDPYGAYNFSTAEQGWQVSDCTAEGLRCGILFDCIPAKRILAGVDQLLALRNPDDGAWCSYENRRSPTWMELLNPANVFHRIMVEHTYTECSSASMQTLKVFMDSPLFVETQHRKEEIISALDCGAKAIKARQLPDGSWYGNWGVCFTYGTMFGIEGLLAAGEGAGCVEIKRAVEFLMSKQRGDGGWSEHLISCATLKYTECAAEQSLPVQTAFALLGLVAGAGSKEDASPEHARCMQRAATFLSSTQRNGTWHQTEICGVFNGTCGIHYPFYCAVMPLWALGAYQRHLSGAGH